MATKKATTKKTATKKATDEAPKADASATADALADIPVAVRGALRGMFEVWDEKQASDEAVASHLANIPAMLPVSAEQATAAWDAFKAEMKTKREAEAKMKAIETFRETLKGYSIPESIQRLAADAALLGGKLVISTAEVEKTDEETGETVKEMTTVIDISTGTISTGRRGRPAGSTNGTGKGSGYNLWQALHRFANRGNAEAKMVIEKLRREPKPDGVKGFQYFIPGNPEPMKLSAAVEAVASGVLMEEMRTFIAKAKRGELV